MSDFYKKFLLEDSRRLSPTGRYAALAAFGKHPGWDDHVEDLGLETESLNLARIVFYVNGIGGQIDAGAWEKLDAAQQLPAFKHVFVWQRGAQIMIGRLWSSSDGKGRKRYPLVVCAQFAGVPLAWALKQTLPVLAELEAGCLQATTAEEVRTLLNRKRGALREAVQAADGKGEYAPVSPEALHQIIQKPGDPKHEGFLRVLYQAESQLDAFAPGKFNPRANPSQLRVQQIRVPLAADNVEQALVFWTRFFRTHADAAVPLLLAAPLEDGWVDATVGEPESHELFCLRASPKAVPLASDVPFTMDDAFRTKATAFLAAFQRGETAAPDLEIAPAPPPATDVPAGSRGGLLKWIGLGAVLILAVIVVGVVLMKSDQPGESAKAATPPPAPVANTTPAPSPAAPPKSDPAEAQRAQAQREEQQRQAAAMAAAQKLKADTEAAAKENERKMAEQKLADEKRAAEMAAAANLKAEAEAAAKENERKMAEAARIAEEKKAAEKKKAAEMEAARLADEVKAAKKKADDEAKVKLAAAAATKPAAAVAGEVTNSIGMVLVPLPSGILVSKYEVTQAEYLKVMGANPSRSVNDRQPVERVSWNDATEFCRKLTELEKSGVAAGKTYRLPTLAQWQGLSASQTVADLPGGGIASRAEPAQVGTLSPANKLGLLDVFGNVSEWTSEEITSGLKVLVGGSFRSPNLRRSMLPDQSAADCGFRCVLGPQ